MPAQPLLIAACCHRLDGRDDQSNSRTSNSAPAQPRHRQPLDALADRGPSHSGRVDRVALPALAPDRRAPTINLGATRTTASPAQPASAPAGPTRVGNPRSPTPDHPAYRRAQASASSTPARAPPRTAIRRPVGPVNRAQYATTLCPLRSRSCAPSPFPSIIEEWTPADTPQSGRMPRSYQVTPVILERRRTTQQAVRPRSTAILRVSPPPAREPTGRVGRHRPAPPTLSL